MRVVLDANVFVSALISDRGNPARIIEWWLNGEFEVLVSQPILEELLRVTSYGRIQSKYARVRENRLEFVDLISKQALLVRPQETLHVITANESDNRYIECAVAGGAAFIVSGDEHLLEQGEYHGIAIVPPATFVALRESGSL
jgi:putative PIN family toxin of toxin-antitoxin system